MSWSQFNPLEADWWEWEIVHEEMAADGVVSFEAAPGRSVSDGLPLIVSQIQFAKETVNMLGDVKTWIWTICPYTVPKQCCISIVHCTLFS